MEALGQNNFHMVAVDQRGFGKSSYNKQCIKFEDWAIDIVELCKLKDISKCVAIGWSFGGAISMKLG